jgi:hypothetical protein
VEVKEQRQVKKTNMDAVLKIWNDDDDDDGVDILKAWKSIRKNMKASVTESLGYYELQQHKPWVHEEC